MSSDFQNAYQCETDKMHKKKSEDKSRGCGSLKRIPCVAREEKCELSASPRLHDAIRGNVSWSELELNPFHPRMAVMLSHSLIISLETNFPANKRDLRFGPLSKSNGKRNY